MVMPLLLNTNTVIVGNQSILQERVVGAKKRFCEVSVYSNPTNTRAAPYLISSLLHITHGYVQLHDSKLFFVSSNCSLYPKPSIGRVS